MDFQALETGLVKRDSVLYADWAPYADGFLNSVLLFN